MNVLMNPTQPKRADLARWPWLAAGLICAAAAAEDATDAAGEDALARVDEVVVTIGPPCAANAADSAGGRCGEVLDLAEEVRRCPAG